MAQYCSAAPSDIALFLGAGISLPEPSGCPLFGEVRLACAEILGIRVDTERDPAAAALLERTIPEVFLAAVTRTGLDLAPPLAEAVRGVGFAAPNAVHDAVARLLHRGGVVWTLNWDTFIEDSYRTQFGADVEVLIPGVHPVPPSPRGRLIKLHGSGDRPETMRFRPSQVIPELPDGWESLIRASMSGRIVIVAGCAGADVDVYAALRAGLRGASAAYWLETGPSWTQSPASTISWRFELDGRLDWADLPVSSGRHLLWCGYDQPISSPSQGLLALLDETGDCGEIPAWTTRYARVLRALTGARDQGALPAGARALAQATVADRLGMTTDAMRGYARALMTADRDGRSKALRMLGYYALRIARRAPQPARALLEWMPWRGAKRTLRAGNTSWETPTAREVETTLRSDSPDELNDLAGRCRWMGSLDDAARLAEQGLQRSLQKNLDDTRHDWLERIARARFELANTALWQGRHHDVEEQCRTGHMQLTGAKWATWDLSLRAAVSAVRGDFTDAERFMEEARRLATAQNWGDTLSSIYLTVAQTARLKGDLKTASEYQSRARSTVSGYPQMSAMVTLEAAEIAYERGLGEARSMFGSLLSSKVAIVAGLAMLRLAECWPESGNTLDQALNTLTKVRCSWAQRRAEALSGHPTTERDLIREGLVPAMCRPGGVWVF